MYSPIRPLFLSILMACLSLGGACTTYSQGTYIGSDNYELARITRADGSVESYVVGSDARQGITLQQTIERDEEVAEIGIGVVELDKSVAARRGVRPFSGLLVRSLAPGSAAEAAGIIVGDVVQAVGDQEVVYKNQMDSLTRGLQGGAPSVLRVLRGQSEIEVSVTPTVRRQRSRDVVDIPLEPAPSNKPYAGVVLRSIPQEWAERIFGEPRSAVLLGGVEVGSPAWIAGFRGGDLITAVDGAPVPPLRTLAQQIAERGASGGRIRLAVSHGDAAPHEGVIALSDYQRTEEVHFPLVFRVVNGVVEDRWSVGPFGLVASSRSQYVQNRSRDLQVESTFDAILGLFHVRSTPNRSTVRLLWFIKFQSG